MQTITKSLFRKKAGLVALAFLVYLAGCKDFKQNRVCFKNNCFNVELAVEPAERARGLMFRESLDYNKGMLFVFEDEREYPFWMKNTLIPLDIIWIDADKEVVFIKNNAEPCKSEACPSVYPGRIAKYVLELSSGVARDIGLKAGNKLIFKLDGR
ncbi:MAG: DUF192 domain-containing protein [Candidatus Omnitrophica bacterium]|nr:DUF192 domain-containing protein [Candidatus Omnitrophota bacterium]